jgi:hypothetical protein
VRLAYSSHDAEMSRAVERLLGGPAREFAFDIESAEQIRMVMRERRVLLLDAEDAVSQALPEELKPRAAAIVQALKTRWAIEVPLIVEEKVIGLLVVHSGDLGQQDRPSPLSPTRSPPAGRRPGSCRTWSAACASCNAPRAS